MDSTSDITRTDQLSLVIRWVDVGGIALLFPCVKNDNDMSTLNTTKLKRLTYLHFQSKCKCQTSKSSNQCQSCIYMNWNNFITSTMKSLTINVSVTKHNIIITLLISLLCCNIPLNTQVPSPQQD